MIKVEVQDYCQDCPYFEADITYPVEYGFLNHDTGERETGFYTNDTTIRCKHRKHCAHLVRVLKGGQQ